MMETAKPFELLPKVLNHLEISEFIGCCKDLLASEGSIPSYALIDRLDSSPYKKVKSVLERHMSTQLFYLNDFYIYTDSTFGTNWHMDTELFTFAHAINAWILLSPNEVTDPLCFIDGINDSPDRYFHSMKAAGDECVFSNYSTGRMRSESLKTIEATRVRTPRIEVGDVLVINPRRFHRTNVEVPKHSIVIKFLFAGENGMLSAERVPSIFWPEVKIFSKLAREHSNWDDFIEGIRGQLKTEKGRSALSAGFYPEKIALYKRMVKTLPA
jgi:hypothetical protein